jgi:hypothetical protein
VWISETFLDGSSHCNGSELAKTNHFQWFCCCETTNAEELQRAAERAWHISFAGEDRQSMDFVVQQGAVTFMKTGPHVLSFFRYPAPYIENHREQISWLPQPSQLEA